MSGRADGPWRSYVGAKAILVGERRRPHGGLHGAHGGCLAARPGLGACGAGNRFGPHGLDLALGPSIWHLGTPLLWMSQEIPASTAQPTGRMAGQEFVVGCGARIVCFVWPFRGLPMGRVGVLAEALKQVGHHQGQQDGRIAFHGFPSGGFLDFPPAYCFLDACA
jgi:hypothetical protein